MDSSKKMTVKLSGKIDLKGLGGGLHGRIFLKINSTFNTHVILAVFFPIYWKRILENQHVGSFVSFYTLVEVG